MNTKSRRMIVTGLLVLLVAVVIVAAIVRALS